MYIYYNIIQINQLFDASKKIVFAYKCDKSGPRVLSSVGMDNA
jgi:hypothetical protein